MLFMHTAPSSAEATPTGWEAGEVPTGTWGHPDLPADRQEVEAELGLGSESPSFHDRGSLATGPDPPPG